MAERPIQDIVPSWLTEGDHRVLPTINSIYFRNFYGLPETGLIVTAAGVEELAGDMESEDSLMDLIGLMLRKGTNKFDSPLFKGLDARPNMVMKAGLFRHGLGVLATVETLNRTLPVETDDYILEPTRYFMATMEYQVMEMVPTQPKNYLSEDGVVYSRGKLRLAREWQQLGYDMLPANNVLLRGFAEDGRPRLAVVGQFEPKVVAEILGK